MALKITTQITTDEGFEVTNAYGYLNIYMLAPNSNWANIAYYKSEADYLAGKAPLAVQDLPENVQTELTSEEFWGESLATVVHNKCIAAIEEITGADSVVVVQ